MFDSTLKFKYAYYRIPVSIRYSFKKRISAKVTNLILARTGPKGMRMWSWGKYINIS
jgi:hypothetical protein